MKITISTELSECKLSYLFIYNYIYTCISHTRPLIHLPLHTQCVYASVVWNAQEQENEVNKYGHICSLPLRIYNFIIYVLLFYCQNIMQIYIKFGFIIGFPTYSKLAFCTHTNISQQQQQQHQHQHHHHQIAMATEAYTFLVTSPNKTNFDQN